MPVIIKDLGQRGPMEGLHPITDYTLRLVLQRIGNKPITRKNIFPMKKVLLLKMDAAVFRKDAIRDRDKYGQECIKIAPIYCMMESNTPI